jgi:hypothetical protein
MFHLMKIGDTCFFHTEDLLSCLKSTSVLSCKIETVDAFGFAKPWRGQCIIPQNTQFVIREMDLLAGTRQRITEWLVTEQKNDMFKMLRVD